MDEMNYEPIDIEDLKLNIEPVETVEYVEIEDVDVVVVETEEAFAALSSSGEVTKHNDLNDRNIPDQHEISAITGLKDILNDLSSVRDVYSTHGGYAEFRPWLKDGYYDTEDIYQGTGGVGYFVSLVLGTGNIDGNNTYVDICRTKNSDGTVDVNDVYGVTVANSGFYGYQDESYNLLDPTSFDKADSPLYTKVCLLGSVKVRVTAEDHLNIKVGDHVVPNELGYATKSENNVGFKVISKGQIEAVGNAATAWYYVEIALVPQNDNIARVMAELEKTKGSLNNVNIQLGEMSGTIDDIYDINIGISDKFDNIQDIVNEGKIEVDKQLQQAQEAVTQAKEAKEKAEEAVRNTQLIYTEAVNKADNALSQVSSAVGTVSDLRSDIKPLASWAEFYECILQKDIVKDEKCYFEINDVAYGFTMPLDMSEGDKIQYDPKTGLITVGETQVPTATISDMTGLTLIEEFTPMGKQGLTGYVAWANEQSVGLSDVTERVGQNSVDIISVTKKIDDNEASLQQLITRADKYSLGPHSLSYKLTYDEAISILKPGYHIYVPTEGHQDEISYIQKDMNPIDFKLGKSYMWKIGDIPDVYTWVENGDVSTETECIPGTNDGDLWYCWQGVLEGNKYIYNPGTLYRWDGSLWISVATVDGDIQARSFGLLKQTADELIVTYSNLDDKIASLRVDVDEISSTVENMDSGAMTSINQTAEEIRMGVYKPEGDSTQLELLLSGMQTTSTEIGIIELKHILDTPPVNVSKFSTKPTWDGSKFVFAVQPSIDGIYYFDKNTEGEDITSCFCEIVNDGYKVYGFNSIAMASLNTRVTNTESEVESWTRFQKGQNETISSIKQLSNEEGTSISSMVYGDFRECVEIKLELTDEDREDLAVFRYPNRPVWETTFVDEDGNEIKEFVFESGITFKGEYCLSKTDKTSYYKLLYRDGEVIGYEKYQMKSSPYSAIVQKVDDSGSSVGLVAGDDNAIGSLFVNAINDKSEVLINADRIGINGITTFSSLFNSGTTTINGSCISSGTIVSNNYNGPVTHKRNGLKIQDNKIVNGLDTDFIYFTTVLEGVEYGGITSNLVYYSCNEIAADEVLTAYTHEIGAAERSFYIVCADNFSLTPALGTTQGMKLNLNDGTIYSKNLILDNKGDLSITGKITATSGYIGNKTSGFIIDYDENGGRYRLYNGQETLSGNGNGSGVYIGPDGVGLGNGNFSVDNSGNITMNGSIVLNGTITWGNGNYPDSGDKNPDYIYSTYIDEVEIRSPTIKGGSIYGGMFYATGQGKDSQPAYYIYNGYSKDNPNNLGNMIGYISYDTNGSGLSNENQNRVLFTTTPGDNVALKISSSGNMSLGAGGFVEDTNNSDSGAGYTRYGGTIFFMSDVSFCPDTTITFTGANIVGLKPVAVFG